MLPFTFDPCKSNILKRFSEKLHVWRKGKEPIGAVVQSKQRRLSLRLTSVLLLTFSFLSYTSQHVQHVWHGNSNNKLNSSLSSRNSNNSDNLTPVIMPSLCRSVRCMFNKLACTETYVCCIGFKRADWSELQPPRTSSFLCCALIVCLLFSPSVTLTLLLSVSLSLKAIHIQHNNPYKHLFLFMSLSFAPQFNPCKCQHWDWSPMRQLYTPHLWTKDTSIFTRFCFCQSSWLPSKDTHYRHSRACPLE